MLAAAEVLSVSSTNLDGYYTIGSAITIEVVFDKNVLVGGQPTLQLETGTTDRLAKFDSAQGSILRFIYTPQVGDTTADLDYTSTTALDTTGVVILAADGSGPAVTTLPAAPGGPGSLGFSKAIVIDTTAPDPAPTVELLTTAVKKPTLTGKATLLTGETLTVTVNGITFSGASPGAIAYDDTTKEWTLDTAHAAPVSGTFSDLADGAYSVTATITDRAGNATNDATTNELIVDTTPPLAPAVNPLVTKIRKPTISGTATLGAGDKLSITLNGFTFDNVPVTGGKWSLNTATATPKTGTFTDLGPDATYDVVATVTDALGNAVADATTGELVIDNSGPTVANVTSSTPDGFYNAEKTILIQVQLSEKVTVVGSPTLALNTVPARVASYVDQTDGVLGTVLNFTYPVLAGDNVNNLDYAGTSALSANFGTIRDAAGNDATLALVAPGAAGSLGANKAIVIDTTAPTAPTVTKKTYSTNQPTIEGTATLGAGDKLTIVVNGATYDNVSAPDGKWSIDTATREPTSGEPGGFVGGTKYSVIATVTDAAGNATKDPTIYEITIDTAVPATPTVDKLLTDKARPTITGTATLVGTQKLKVVVGGATYDDVPVTGGEWSLDTKTATPKVGTAFTDLTDGTHSVTATVADDVGNSAGDTTTGEITADLTAPTVVNVNSSTDDGFYKAGKTISIRVAFSESVTVDTTLGSPTLALDAATGRVATYDAANSALNIVAFSYTVQPGDDTNDLDCDSATALARNGATIRDAAGNDADLTKLPVANAAGSLSANKDIVIDTTAPAAPSVTKKTYNTNLLVIEGTIGTDKLADGEWLTVVVNGATYEHVAVAPGTTPAKGTWSIDTATLAPTEGEPGGFTSNGSPYSVTATVTDAAGNATKDPTFHEISIDTVAPAVPTVDSLRTNDTKPMITGTATLDATDTLTVVLDGYPFSSTVPNTFTFIGTTWSLDTSADPDFPGLADGTYDVVATVTDAAGNAAADTTTGELVIDTVPASVIDVTSSTPDGAYTAGSSISIQIQLDKVVVEPVAGTLVTLALKTGRNATYVGKTDNPLGSVLTLTYTVVAGDNIGDLDYVDANSLLVNFGPGTIRDAAGNIADLELADPGTPGSLGANKDIVIDTTPPGAPSVDRLSTLVRLPTITGTAPTLDAGESLSVEIRDNTNATVLARYDNVAVSAGKWSVDTDLTATAAGGFLTPLASGFYSVKATVTDPAGNQTSDGTFKELIVGACVQMVTSTIDDGTYGVGAVIPISVLFSDVVNVSVALLNPTLSLNTTPTRVATYTGVGTGTRVLVFNYVVQPGDSATDLDYTKTGLTLNFATIRDAANNDASLVLPVPGDTWSLGGTKNIDIDTIAPNVAPTVDPLTTNVLKPTLTGTATLADDETLLVTVNGFTFSSAQPNTFTFTGTNNWSLNTATAPSIPTGFANLADGIYDVVARVSDGAGNSITDAIFGELEIDIVRPTVTIASDMATLAIGQTAEITFTLSELSADFATGDATATGGTLGVITQLDDFTYTATFTPNAGSMANGTVTVAANKFRDAAGNWNASGTLAPRIAIDTVAPGIALTSNRSTLNGTQTATITFTLTENSTDFGLDDVTVTGGTLGLFSGTGRTYTATFTPFGTGTGTVSVAAGTFHDGFGNPNTAGALAPTLTIDAVAPTVTITSDLYALNGTQTATITFKLSKPSTEFATGDATVTGGVLGPITGAADTYSATFTPNPSPSGTGTVTVAASKFTDAFGNPNVAGMLTPTIRIDTVAPTARPTVNPLTTNNPLPTISGTATLAIGETLSVTVNGVTFPVTNIVAGKWSLNTATATPSAGGPFTGLADGTYDVTATAADAAANSISDNTFDELVIDTIRPTVLIVSDRSTLNGIQTAKLTFTLSEASTNFTSADVTITGGTISALTGSGTLYSTTFTPTAGFVGNGTVTVAGGVFTDLSGNGNIAGALAPDIVIDALPPTVTTTSDRAALREGQAAVITFTLSENSTTFGPGDAVVTGGTLGPITGSGMVYTATFTPNPNFTGNGTLTIPAGAFTDPDGNANAAGSLAIPIDTLRPTVTITPSAPTLKAGQTATITFTLSEPSTTFTAADVTAAGGVLSGFTGSGMVYAATFTPNPSPSAIGTVSVAAGTFTDLAGNDNTAGIVNGIAIDTVAPTVTSITGPGGTYGPLQTVRIAVTFSEPVFKTGTPLLLLNTTPARWATYSGGTGTSTLTFTYTTQPGDVSTLLNASALSLNGGTLRDAAGNNAVLTPLPSLAGSNIVIAATVRITSTNLGTGAFTPPGPKFSLPVTTINLTFNAPVSGVSLNSFRLYFENRSVSLRGAVVRGSGTSWTLVLPSTATSLRGRYRLDVGGAASGITCGGVPVTTFTSLYWQR